MKRARSQRRLSALVGTLYLLGATAIPVVHNAWHELAHGRAHEGSGEAHSHDAHAQPAQPRPRLLHANSAGAGHARPHHHHPQAQKPGRSLPEPVPADPDHTRDRGEHLGVALGLTVVVAVLFHEAPLENRLIVNDPSVFAKGVARSAAQPRAPPVV